MTQENYSYILFTGYFDNPKFLANYYVRECNKANENGTPPLEFFDRLLEVINSLKTEIQEKYWKRFNMLSFIISDREQKGQDVKVISDERDQLTDKCFTVPITTITKGRYHASMGLNEIDFISNELYKAQFYFLGNELNKATENLKNVVKEKIKLGELKYLPEPITTNSFKLLNNVLTTDCFNTLIKHHFINSSTCKRDFEKIFRGEKIINKIDWIGTIPELSRLVFFLHKDYEKDDNVAVCSLIKKVYLVTCKCFTHKGNEIRADQIKNNNRELKDKSRNDYLLKAIKHLQKPNSATPIK